jgi:CO/xanthine dehydrogenase Mo-binding subunit
VTGAARYTSDLHPPGCLHVAIVRSEVAHAALHDVDVTAARAVPGVVTTLVGCELAHLDAEFGEWLRDQRPLATDRIRYHGEPIAAVVGDDPGIARRAAALVTASTTPLPVAADIEAALDVSATAIHPPDGRGRTSAPHSTSR